MTMKKGMLAAAKMVTEDEELILISEEGVVVRTPVAGISEQGRNTQGVRVMNVAKKDKVTAVGIAEDSKGRRHKRVGAAGDSESVDVDTEEQ